MPNSIKALFDDEVPTHESNHDSNHKNSAAWLETYVVV
jgi:hypothetical protein